MTAVADGTVVVGVAGVAGSIVSVIFGCRMADFTGVKGTGLDRSVIMPGAGYVLVDNGPCEVSCCYSGTDSLNVSCTGAMTGVTDKRIVFSAGNTPAISPLGRIRIDTVVEHFVVGPGNRCLL